MGNKGGGAINKAAQAARSVYHAAKAVVAAIAHNWAKAIKEAHKSPMIKKIVAGVLALVMLLILLVPVIIGGIVEGLINLVGTVLEDVADFFGGLWDAIFGDDEAAADPETGGSMSGNSIMLSLAGTSYAVAPPDRDTSEDVTFTSAMGSMLSQNAVVLESYLKQRAGDYKDLADTIASSYSTSNVTYEGTTYSYCNVSATVNTTSMPLGTGQKLACAFLAQVKDKNYPVTIHEWLGKRTGSGHAVTIDGKTYTIQGYTGSFLPQYKVDERLADGSTDFSGSSLIDEIVYVSSVTKNYYVTYVQIPIFIPDPIDPSEPTEPVEPTEPDPTPPRPPRPGHGEEPYGSDTGMQTRAATRRIEYIEVPVLNLNISVTVSYREVDDLIYDTIGLWTGDADNYDKTTLINNYGDIGDTQITNPTLLKASWTSGGKTYNRLTVNQVYYYQLYSTFCGLFNPIHRAGGDGSNIVAVAEAEYQLYLEDTSLSGGDKYWSWYYGSKVGPHHPEAWCCLFLYWCANQCGYLEEGGCFGPTVFVNCRDVWNDFCARDETYTYATAPNYEPSPGDIVFFGNAASIDHVGFVKSFDKETHTVTTIEGNTLCDAGSRGSGSGYNVVWEKQCDGVYANSRWTIYGYAHPNYPLGYYHDMLFMFYEASNNPACIAYDDGGGWSYGVTQFNTKSQVIDDFLFYLRDHYPDMFITYFADLPYDSGHCVTWSEADTGRLQTAWVSCANAEGETFFNAQMEYTVIIVQPFFDYVMDGYGIDLKRSRALLEMSYCRSIQSGPSGAYNMFKQAFPDREAAAKMSDTELINGFYDVCVIRIPSMTERLNAERRDVLALVVD